MFYSIAVSVMWNNLLLIANFVIGGLAANQLLMWIKIMSTLWYISLFVSHAYQIIYVNLYMNKLHGYNIL